MIQVEAAVDRSGVLEWFVADGHALFGPPGSDPVCAAASVLLRTAARTLECDAGIKIGGDGVTPGHLAVEVRRVDPQRRAWATGVSDNLLRGLRDLVEEYPDRVKLVVRIAEER